MSMKNSNDNIGNRTCDLPACSAVPQPTAPPRAPPAPRNWCIFTLQCPLSNFSGAYWCMPVCLSTANVVIHRIVVHSRAWHSIALGMPQSCNYHTAEHRICRSVLIFLQYEWFFTYCCHFTILCWGTSHGVAYPGMLLTSYGPGCSAYKMTDFWTAITFVTFCSWCNSFRV
jgi:hypothetical protein